MPIVFTRSSSEHQCLGSEHFHAPLTSLSWSGIWLANAEKKRSFERSLELNTILFFTLAAVPTSEAFRSCSSSGIRARKRQVQLRCPTPILRNFANGFHINIPSQAVQTRSLLSSLWHFTPHLLISLWNKQTRVSAVHLLSCIIYPQARDFPSLKPKKGNPLHSGTADHRPSKQNLSLATRHFQNRNLIHELPLSIPQ